MKSIHSIGFLFFAALLCVNSTSFAQSPSWLWAGNFGGTKEVRAYNIAVDGIGGVYTTGSFLGTADFDSDTTTSYNLTSAGTANADLYISKLDSSGNFVWAKNIGIASEEIAYSLVTDDFANLYVTGVFSGTVDFDPGPNTVNLISAGAKDVFVLKLDSAGNFVWARNVGGASEDVAFAVGLDALNNILVTGSFTTTADFDPGPLTYNLTTSGNRDVFVLKLNDEGDFVWAKKMGGSDQEWANAIAVDADGNVYTTGKFAGTADFDPSNVSSDSITAMQYDDIFISKLDSSGNHLWAVSFPGNGTDVGNALSADEPGKLYITGRFAGTADFDPSPSTAFNITASGGYDNYICKLTSGGNFVWVKNFDGAADETGQSLAFDNSGNGAIISSGSFSGTTDFNPGSGTSAITSAGTVDTYISKLDTAANFVWVKTIGGSDTDYNCFIAKSATGKLYAVGTFNSLNITFDTHLVSNINTTFTAFDVFVAKLDNIPTGIENISDNKNDIILYPNPVNSILSISLPLNSDKASISIVDVTGKVVMEIKNPDKQKVTIDINDFDAGIYLVKVEANSFVEVRRIVVLK